MNPDKSMDDTEKREIISIACCGLRAGDEIVMPGVRLAAMNRGIT